MTRQSYQGKPREILWKTVLRGGLNPTPIPWIQIRPVGVHWILILDPLQNHKTP